MKRTSWTVLGVLTLVALAAAAFIHRGGHFSGARSPDTRVLLTGRILVGSDGLPPPETRVRVHPRAQSDFAHAFDSRLDLAPEEVLEVAVEGDRYRVELPGPGEYAVSASAPGFGASWITLAATAPSTRDLRLEPSGFSWELELRQPNQDALGGALVSVYSHDGVLLDRQRTDGRGRFVTKLPGGLYRFVFSSAGFAPHARSVWVLSDERRVITLHRAVSLEANVSGGAGRPVRVTLVDELGRIAADAQAASDGSARFDGLLPGSYQIWAGHPDADARQAIVLPSSEAPVKTELRLKPSAPIRLKLQERACAPQVTAAAPTQDGRSLHREIATKVASSAAGREVLFTLPPVNSRVLLSCAGERARLAFGAEGSMVSEHAWGAAGSLRGSVADPSGAPLGGAIVTVINKPADAASWSRAVMTGEGGGFALDDFPGDQVSLEVFHPRYGSITRTLALSRAQEPLSVQFLAEDFVEGRVTDAAGAPVAGATVAFASRTAGSLSQVSSTDGKFKIGPVGPGPGFLLAFKDGRTARTEPLSVSARGEEPVALVLDRLTQGTGGEP